MATINCQIELRHFRYFVAASEYGSLRKAGAALGIQESTISRSIRDLEDRLGASLFQRHSGGVSLTIAGERFLHRARIVLRQISEGVRDVAAIGRCENGCIRVGIYSSLASGFLAELVRTYDRHHANIRIDLIDGNPAEHIASIRKLGLDVAFITGSRKWSDCETISLWSERVFVVLHESHALTKKDQLSWLDLAHERFIVSDSAPGPEIHDYLVQRLADFSHHPEIQPQHISRDNLLSLVAMNRGLTLTSEATTVALGGLALC